MDQLATEVKIAAAAGARLVFQRSVTTGWRVGSHFNLCSGTGNRSLPMFSPKVKRAMMLTQIIDRRSGALIDLDLLDARVALDVKNALASQQIVIEFLGAADIEDRVRLAVKLLDFRQADSSCWMLGQIARAEAPAPLESELARQLPKHLGSVSEVVARLEGLRVVGNSGGVFDVVNVVPETLQPDEVMDVLPDDTGDRH